MPARPALIDSSHGKAEPLVDEFVGGLARRSATGRGCEELLAVDREEPAVDERANGCGPRRVPEQGDLADDAALRDRADRDAVTLGNELALGNEIGLVAVSPSTMSTVLAATSTGRNVVAMRSSATGASQPRSGVARRMSRCSGGGAGVSVRPRAYPVSAAAAITAPAATSAARVPARAATSAAAPAPALIESARVVSWTAYTRVSVSSQRSARRGCSRRRRPACYPCRGR